MIAVVCGWRGDLEVGPGGDIHTAPPPVEIHQRVIRRLLTNPGDYIWHSDYGAGLGGYIGTVYSSNFIESVILNQLQFEGRVAPMPPPTVRIDRSGPGLALGSSATVRYQVTDTFSGSSVTVGFGA